MAKKGSGRTTVICEGTIYAERMNQLQTRYPDLSKNKIIETFANKGAEYYDKHHEGEFLADVLGKK